jgi:hypothetical protein
LLSRLVCALSLTGNSMSAAGKRIAFAPTPVELPALACGASCDRDSIPQIYMYTSKILYQPSWQTPNPPKHKHQHQHQHQRKTQEPGKRANHDSASMPISQSTTYCHANNELIIYTSKRYSEYFDPCQEAADRSLKCLRRNGGDRLLCADYFE